MSSHSVPSPLYAYLTPSSPMWEAASYRVWTFSSETLFLSQQDFNYVCGLEETFTQEEHIVVECVYDFAHGSELKRSQE